MSAAFEQSNLTAYLRARDEFRHMHQRAVVQSWLGRLWSKPTNLSSFEEVRQRLGTASSGLRQLREICLDCVLGSVGRARDYTPDFLPRRGNDEERWARVRRAIDEDGVPPIEVYEVGGAYYVQDGHHRVSVFKRLGVRCVEAYVTRVQPLSAQ
jgi:hypothetical protein